jgi:hypothetical protein
MPAHDERDAHKTILTGTTELLNLLNELRAEIERLKGRVAILEQERRPLDAVAKRQG